MGKPIRSFSPWALSKLPAVRLAPIWVWGIRPYEEKLHFFPPLGVLLLIQNTSLRSPDGRGFPCTEQFSVTWAACPTT